MENWVGKDKKVLLRLDFEVLGPAVVNRGAVCRYLAAAVPRQTHTWKFTRTEPSCCCPGFLPGKPARTANRQRQHPEFPLTNTALQCSALLTETSKHIFFPLCQYFLSCLSEIGEKIRGRAGAGGRCLAGDALLPLLVRVLWRARNWEKMESWGQTAASWKKTRPCATVFVLLAM